MIQSATGLILRVRPLTETSLIVLWLTREFGRISTVARGARRSKSPFRGKLDLFYELDFSFSRSVRSELHALREVNPRNLHTELRHDLHLLRQASYAGALVEQCTESDTPIPGMYDLFHGLLEFLPTAPPVAQTLFAFELKILRELGLEPKAEHSRLTEGASRISAALLAGDWPLSTRIQVTPAQRNELRSFLHGFIVFHLGRIPRGRGAALQQETVPL